MASAWEVKRLWYEDYQLLRLVNSHQRRQVAAQMLVNFRGMQHKSFRRKIGWLFGIHYSRWVDYILLISPFFGTSGSRGLDELPFLLCCLPDTWTCSMFCHISVLIVCDYLVQCYCTNILKHIVSSITVWHAWVRDTSVMEDHRKYLNKYYQSFRSLKLLAYKHKIQYHFAESSTLINMTQTQEQMIQGCVAKVEMGKTSSTAACWLS